MNYDLIIVGAGSAGMTAGIFSVKHGAKVLILDASPSAGGTLKVATGQMSAAGTRLQKERGIHDTPLAHYADVMRISRNTARPAFVRLAVENAADTFDWLMDNGYEPLPEHPVLGDTHEPYSAARYYWGKDFGRSILHAVLPVVEETLKQPNCDSEFEFRVSEILTSEDGSQAIGVKGTAKDGSVKEFFGNKIILATGGYNGSPEEFNKRTGHRLVSTMLNPFARGDGHNIGEKLGGQVIGVEKFLCSFGSVMDSPEFPSPVLCRPEHRPDRRQPWEIYINQHGERFVAEDNPSVDEREHALVKQPAMRRYIVFDQAIKDQAPQMMQDMTPEKVDELWNNHPMFHRAETLEELAALIDVPAENLLETVRVYNTSESDPWGRKFRPAKVESGPFYAVTVHGISITSTSGLDVDDEFRLRRADGTSVESLYILGELLGAAQTMGNAFCGGMMATPAMTFGRLLGTRLAKEAVQQR